MMKGTISKEASFCPGLWSISLWIMGISVLLFVLAFCTAASADDQKGMRATELMDRPVVSDKEEEIAEIDDMILKRNGKVKRLILSCCGILGLEGKKVTVPFRRLEIEGEDIIYDISKKEFEKKAGFDYTQEGLYRGYHTLRPGSGGPQPPPYSPRRSFPGYYDPYYPRHTPPLGSWKKNYCEWESAYSPGSVLGSVIIGRSVVNTECQRIGFVDDLIISPQGRIKELVLSTIGLEKDLISLKYRPFKLTYWGLAYDVTMEELRNLPEYRYQEK